MKMNINIHIHIAITFFYITAYYKTKSTVASVCVFAINSETTELIFMRFSLIDSVIS